MTRGWLSSSWVLFSQHFSHSVFRSILNSIFLSEAPLYNQVARDISLLVLIFTTAKLLITPFQLIPSTLPGAGIELTINMLPESGTTGCSSDNCLDKNSFFSSFSY